MPEIALTPAIAALFRDDVRRPRRHPAQRPLRRRAPRSVAPHPPRRRGRRRRHADPRCSRRSERIGLIVVDEEHDGSYKQEEIPRYNGSRRGDRPRPARQALIVLGSATPSIETYHHAMIGKHERVVLARRVLDRPLADVKIVDMREEFAAEGPDVILSRASARRDPDAAGAPRTVARAPQPPRVRDRRLLPPMRRHASIARTAACPSSCTARATPAARAATTATTPSGCRKPVRCARARTRSGRDWDRACRGRSESARPVGAGRTARPRRHSASRRARVTAGALSRRRDRCARRHSDDCQRSRLPAGHARRRGVGRRRPRPRGLSSVGADLSAAHRRSRVGPAAATKPGEAIIQTLYPGITASSLPANRIIRPSTNANCNSGARCAIRPSCRSSTPSSAPARFSQAMDDAAGSRPARAGRGCAWRFSRAGPGAAAARKATRRGYARASAGEGNESEGDSASRCEAALAGRPDVQRRAVVDIDPLSVL